MSEGDDINRILDMPVEHLKDSNGNDMYFKEDDQVLREKQIAALIAWSNRRTAAVLESFIKDMHGYDFDLEEGTDLNAFVHDALRNSKEYIFRQNAALSLKAQQTFDPTEISPCPNCNCMTHTIYKVGADVTVKKEELRNRETYRTVCGKCGAAKDEQS